MSYLMSQASFDLHKGEGGFTSRLAGKITGSMCKALSSMSYTEDTGELFLAL